MWSPQPGVGNSQLSEIAEAPAKLTSTPNSRSSPPPARIGTAGGGEAAGAFARGGVLPMPPPPPPEEPQGTFVRSERKVGRNEPCPCGSGKKYKHCHGALSSVE